MDYSVTIDQFEGPLDLLLHLIKESKLSILEIKVEEIAVQYLTYLHQMESMNLSIASEYLVMASELMEIKSKSLLPKHEEESDEEEDDPKEKLIKRLVEYEQYKEVTKDLREREELRKEIYTKSPEPLKEYLDPMLTYESDLEMNDLVEALRRVLKRLKEEQPLSTKVTSKEITIEKRRQEIKDLLKREKRVSFFSLFTVPTREYIVVTFLAILEMARAQELKILQKDNFEEITCEVLS